MAKAYAEELARHGISIIFVTRDHTSVRDTATALSQSYGVETIIVLADFSLDQSASKPIKEAIRGKDIGFLVNCVDESLATPQSLTEMPEQVLLDLMNENVLMALLMVRLVLPGMLERSRGAVVNISSGACCRPLPGRAALTASTVRAHREFQPPLHTHIQTCVLHTCFSQLIELLYIQYRCYNNAGFSQGRKITFLKTKLRELHPSASFQPAAIFSLSSYAP